MDVVVGSEVWEECGHGAGDFAHDGDDWDGAKCRHCLEALVAFEPAGQVCARNAEGDVVGDDVGRGVACSCAP